MPTSTRTLLEVLNSVLLSIGERTVTNSTATLGQMALDCIRESLIEVSTSYGWNELRDVINASSWSGDSATLPTTVSRIQGVNWYSSPDGLPESTYDYARLAIEFTTLDTYLRYPLTPYTNSAQNRPRWYTIVDVNTVRVNPYPNDATEQGKITFDVYKLLELPTLDSDVFSCSDQLLNVVQHKAASLMAIKFLSDYNLAKVFDEKSEKNRRTLMVSDSGYPSSGYTLFRDGRR